MKFTKSFDLKMFGHYEPFDGLMGNVRINLGESLADTLENEQTEYNPMVGNFDFNIFAKLTVEDCELKEVDDKIIVTNREELLKNKDFVSFDKDNLLALEEACKKNINWSITESHDGIVANVLKLQFKVLKSYDFNFGRDIDVLMCADAVSGDMLDIVTKALAVRNRVTTDNKDIMDTDIGVAILDDIDYAKDFVDSELLEWVFNNIGMITSSYVATALYVVAVDKEQAYHSLSKDEQFKLEHILNNCEFNTIDDEDIRYKELME